MHSLPVSYAAFETWDSIPLDCHIKLPICWLNHYLPNIFHKPITTSTRAITSECSFLKNCLLRDVGHFNVYEAFNLKQRTTEFSKDVTVCSFIKIRLLSCFVQHKFFYRQSTLNRYLIFAPGVTNSIQFWISYRVVTYGNWRRRRRRNQMTIKRMVMAMLIDKTTASATTTGASVTVIVGSWVVLAVESSQQRQTNNEWKIKFNYLHLDEMNTFIHQTAKNRQNRLHTQK